MREDPHTEAMRWLIQAEEEWKEYKEVLHNSLFSYEEVGTFQEFLK